MKNIFKYIIYMSVIFVYENSMAENKSLSAEQAIKYAKLGGETFHSVSLFNSPEQKMVEGIGNYIHYTLDENKLQNAFNANYQSIKLSLPLPDGTKVNLLLTQHQILTDDFRLTITDRNGQHEIEKVPGLYYYGIIDGYNGHSIAAVSLFKNELAGVISDESGNWNLGPMKDREGEYVYYNDMAFHIPLHFECGTDDNVEVHSEKMPEVLSSAPGYCVTIGFDCDYAFFLNKGSVTNVYNYVSSLFNVEATLYGNESINVSIKGVNVWTTPDPYDSTTRNTAYNSYIGTSQIPASIGHLLAMAGNHFDGLGYLGGVGTANGYAYSRIHGYYSLYPTYSWDALVNTHEDGHVMGSNHTHWCGWSNGAIDSCGPAAGYPFEPDGLDSCFTAPMPTSGTIMSYCNLVNGVGINFINGFGPEPGNTVRAGVVLAGSLGWVSSCTLSCLPVVSVGYPIVTGNNEEYSASDILYGNNVVQNGATGLFRGTNLVKLSVGFHAEVGSTFRAWNASCPPTPISLSLNYSALKSTNNSNNSFESNNEIGISPNPFYSMFELSLNLKQEEETKLVIYNPLGIKVRELINHNLSKGLNKYTFDCGDLASGVYFIEINLGDSKIVKKIVKN